MPPRPPKSVLQVLTALGLAVPGCVESHEAVDARTGLDASGTWNPPADSPTLDIPDSPPFDWGGPDIAGGNIPPDGSFGLPDVPDASDDAGSSDAPDGDEDADAGT